MDQAPASEPAATVAPAAPAPVAQAKEQDVLLGIRDLKTYFPIYGGIFRRKMGDVYAVDGVTLDVHRGETLGLVGESGCGKTTLGRSVIRLTPLTGGQVIFDGIDVATLKGRDLKRMRRRMQIIFQDPVGSLNPRMPISDIIGEGLLAQADSENSWGKRQVRDKQVGDSLEAVGLRREYTRRFPHEFSGGQRQRIGIARALALKPDFVVCDEPVSALDVSIQSQVLNLLIDLRREFGLTFLFIAHNLSVVQFISDRVGVMYLGPARRAGRRGDAVPRARPPVHHRPALGHPRSRPAGPQEAPRAQGRRAKSGGPAVGLSLPYALLAARAARQPGELRHG